MREFTIRYGKNKGIHKIYESIKEAVDNGIFDIKSPWYSTEVEPGFWVVSDDGYVVQCLARRKLVCKHHRSGQYTNTFTFPQGIFWVYYGRTGKKTIKSFYAAVTNTNRSSLGSTSSLGRYMTAKKKLFVIYVSKGMEPYYAFRKAYNMRMAPPAVIFTQVNKLLNDELVRKALMEQMEPFLEMVRKKVKEKTGHDDLLEYIAEQIALLVTEEGLSPKERATNIKLMLDIFSQQLGLTQSKKPGKEILASYEDVMPPVLIIPENIGEQ
jgi:hypothetical protein